MKWNVLDTDLDFGANFFRNEKNTVLNLGVSSHALGPAIGDGGKKWLWDDNRWQVPWEQSWDSRDGSI